MNIYAKPSKPEPPERIYGWLNTPLSLARHYGGIKCHGHLYQIDYLTKGEPLVRVDVLVHEAKARKDESKRLSKLAQVDLF